MKGLPIGMVMKPTGCKGGYMGYPTGEGPMIFLSLPFLKEL